MRCRKIKLLNRLSIDILIKNQVIYVINRMNAKSLGFAVIIENYIEIRHAVENDD